MPTYGKLEVWSSLQQWSHFLASSTNLGRRRPPPLRFDLMRCDVVRTTPDNRHASTTALSPSTPSRETSRTRPAASWSSTNPGGTDSSGAKQRRSRCSCILHPSACSLLPHVRPEFQPQPPPRNAVPQASRNGVSPLRRFFNSCIGSGSLPAVPRNDAGTSAPARP